MSSSGEIYSQIIQCKNEIADCEEQIRKLKIRIDDQQRAYKSFQRKAANFSEVLTRKKKKSEAIFELSERSTLAKSYSDRMGFELADKSSKEQQLNEIDGQMNKEIQNNQSELNSLETRLANLRARLNSLQSEYQAALRREEEERQAAAAAAAKSSK